VGLAEWLRCQRCGKGWLLPEKFLPSVLNVHCDGNSVFMLSGEGSVGDNSVGTSEVAAQKEDEAIRLFLADQGKASFEAVFAIFYPRAIRFFLARGVERETCQDLAQNVFLAVFRFAADVQHPTRFRAWLFRIIRNEWLQHQRRCHALVHFATTESLSDHVQVCDTRLSPHLAAEMNEMLRLLSVDERETVLLHFFDGLAYREIAELLNVAVGTVKWRIFQVKMKLAESRQQLSGMHG
jgi:RNA polymerase sigma-70 factor, ECF subfamily